MVQVQVVNGAAFNLSAPGRERSHSALHMVAPGSAHCRRPPMPAAAVVELLRSERLSCLLFASYHTLGLIPHCSEGAMPVQQLPEQT